LPSSSIKSRIGDRLSAIERSGQKRTLMPPRGIDLSSNDSLGLSTHPEVVAALLEGTKRYGCGSSASRLLRGDRDIWHEVESCFARFKNTEHALYFSSGYAANLGVLGAFLEDGDVVFSDALNHASLIDGMRLGKARCVVFAHGRPDELERALIEEPCKGHRWIVTESLFSMDGDVAPLAEYATLCQQYNASLIVDEAHAVGIYGQTGRGIAEELGVENNVFLSINSAGKALGVAGAFVAGPEWALQYLVQRARTLIFSTAAPPALAAALIASLQVLAREPTLSGELKRKSQLLHNLLQERAMALPTSSSHIVPIVIGDNERAMEVADGLQRAGYDVRAIRPPTVSPGTSRLRVSVNTSVSDKILLDFAEALTTIKCRILNDLAPH
jgi:8-amino-7-oxononanoate synthase